MTYKRIMLATDGSEASSLALDEAIKLAANQKACLRVIHVVEEGFVYHGGPGFDQFSIATALREEGQRILDKVTNTIKKRPSIQFEATLIELKPFQGRIAEAIIEETKEWEADLLIVGTHGRRGFSHLFLGSVAEQLIRVANTPILLVRGQKVS